MPFMLDRLKVELKVLIIRHVILWYFVYLNNCLKYVWEKSEIPTKLQMLLLDIL